MRPWRGSAAATWSETPSGTSSAFDSRTAHQLGVGAGCRRPRDPVADGDLADVGADGDDRPGALRAHDVRERHRVHAGPAVRVDEVDPGGGDADEDLVGGGLGVGELGELEDVGTAGGGGSDGAHGSTNTAERARAFPEIARSYLRAALCMFMHMTFTVAVAGASGYAGGEMLRVLARAPRGPDRDPHRALQRRHAARRAPAAPALARGPGARARRASTSSPATTSSSSPCRTAPAARSPPSSRRAATARSSSTSAPTTGSSTPPTGSSSTAAPHAGHLAVRPARAAAPGGADRDRAACGARRRAADRRPRLQRHRRLPRPAAGHRRGADRAHRPRRGARQRLLRRREVPQDAPARQRGARRRPAVRRRRHAPAHPRDRAEPAVRGRRRRHDLVHADARAHGPRHPRDRHGPPGRRASTRPTVRAAWERTLRRRAVRAPPARGRSGRPRPRRSAPTPRSCRSRSTSAPAAS